MIRIPALLAVVFLAGCSTTSISEIRTREVQDTAVVQGQTIQQVRDCLVEALGLLRDPIETGPPERRELTFSTPEAGAIFFYVLQPAEGGVKVEARRKNAIANGFNKGRRCYQ
ncbi:hypothetical protein LQ953_13295 [Sphingomonas sp. IC-56]|uniref:hypothetical protein n=1 Tax=Sphingomonas sp. IC-56 TaxID=2898529 RepID=UPI001E449D85|nr:hypothetical protein [Sphingomonas sp. IC-56]MCD2324993.1 hypothetical protein [Sphingomonas sp. IC-56]